MIETPNDGGPAFPSGKSETPGFENSLPYYEGMTLRDWFAGMWAANQKWGSEGYSNSANIASDAYAIADAMLAARNKGGDA